MTSTFDAYFTLTTVVNHPDDATLTDVHIWTITSGNSYMGGSRVQSNYRISTTRQLPGQRDIENVCEYEETIFNGVLETVDEAKEKFDFHSLKAFSALTGYIKSCSTIEKEMPF